MEEQFLTKLPLACCLQLVFTPMGHELRKMEFKSASKTFRLLLPYPFLFVNPDVANAED
jgi:hypothetical protein